MHFELLSNNDTDKWDDFVEKSPQGSIFSTSAFLDALSTNYRIGVLVDKGKIKAGIVLARNELAAHANPLLAKYLGVLLEPTSNDTKYITKFSRECYLVEELVRHLDPYWSFDYSFHPNFTNWLPFYWAGYRQEVRYTYRFHDLQDIDRIIRGSSTRLRRNLRKAEKNGVYIRPDVELEDFFRINNLTFQRQGGKAPYSLKRLRSLSNGLGMGQRFHTLGAFERSGQLVSVAGVVNDTRCAYLLFNGSDYTAVSNGTNAKLIIETIKYCSGFVPTFDFEGSMMRQVEFFYRSFGAEQVPYFSIWRNNLLVISKRKLITLYKKLNYSK